MLFLIRDIHNAHSQYIIRDQCDKYDNIAWKSENYSWFKLETYKVLNFAFTLIPSLRKLDYVLIKVGLPR